jgi:hypothetical protein
MTATATRKPSTNGHDGATAAPSPTGGNGRAANGTFARGNKCAVGNPHARRVNALRNELFAVVTPAAMKRVATKLLALAEGGDVLAVKLLLRYTLGRPRYEADPDHVEAGLDLWQLLAAMPSQNEAMRQAASGVDAAEAAQFLSDAWGHASTWDKLRLLGMLKVLSFRNQDGTDMWPPPETAHEVQKRARAAAKQAIVDPEPLR